jgi:hypothetical protein
MQIRPLADDMIGGGFVRRPGGYSSRGKTISNGTHLSREEILAMPRATRQAMLNIGYIEVYPKAGDVERFLVPRGEGAYDVVEGRKVNSEPLTNKQARAMLG